MKKQTMKSILLSGIIAVSAGMAQAQVKVLDPQKDPNIEVQTKAFLKVLNSGGGKPIQDLPVADARMVLVNAQKSVKVDLSGIEVEEKHVTQDGINIHLYIVRPEGVSGVLPAFMFYHGGGWILGDFPTHERLVRDLVVQSGAVAVFVEYTRSPEAKYPVAQNECYAGLKWTYEHAAEINVDPNRLALAGNSVGGNMVATIALLAKDKNGPKLKFQLMFWPVTNDDFETPSYNQFAEYRFLTKPMMIWFWDAYCPKDKRNNKYVCPLKATVEELKGLPPAMIQASQNDVLTDEGQAYGRKLNLAGVPVSWLRVDGMIHDYGMLNPLAAIPAVQTAVRIGANELKNALK